MRISTTFKQLSVIQFYLALVALLLLVVASTFVTQSREALTPQDRGKLIKFSHTFHIKEIGVGCADCHTAAPTSTLAADNLLPKMAACQTCHDEQVQNTCTYCHTSADTTTYVAFETPRHDLHFNHSFHLNDQKVACETCHKGLETVTIASEKNIPVMDACMTCHDGAKASNACETCHTNFAALRPKEHNRTDWVKEHKLYARMQDATCMTCHTQESCQDCHTNAGLVQTGLNGKDLVSPHSPRITEFDRGQGMALTKVHDLNFRFTHGVAASSKTMECQTCHDTKEFCSTCHMAGGNVNQVEFTPTSHKQSGFILLGLGTGGGLHAQLARRDIESCAACHDAQGADPACVKCHFDNDGIKGTNYRTHSPGFMSNVEGPWHSDPGAACYVCHTDPNAHVGGTRGQGFCGYCHQ